MGRARLLFLGPTLDAFHGRDPPLRPVLPGLVEELELPAVQAVLEADPDVADVFVGAVEDPEWGQRICAAVVPAPGAHPWRADTQRRLAVVVKDALGGPAAPKTWLALDALPLLSTGKPDRRALTALFAAAPRP